MYYVYVIYNTKADKLYIGQTSNLTRRLREHNTDYENKKHHTSKFPGQWSLIYKEVCKNRSTAITREKQLKTSRGRVFVKSFINNPG